MYLYFEGKKVVLSCSFQKYFVCLQCQQLIGAANSYGFIIGVIFLPIHITSKYHNVRYCARTVG